jgi:hypothetical protein
VVVVPGQVVAQVVVAVLEEVAEDRRETSWEALPPTAPSGVPEVRLPCQVAWEASWGQHQALAAVVVVQGGLVAVWAASSYVLEVEVES